jgi:plasmid stabilization system protein ParE
MIRGRQSPFYVPWIEHLPLKSAEREPDLSRVEGPAPVRFKRRKTMPRGDKSKYTGKQKRKAEHIEEGYEKRGVSSKEAERRAWATVNKQEGGGKKGGTGSRKKSSSSSKRKSSSSAKKKSSSGRKKTSGRKK